MAECPRDCDLSDVLTYKYTSRNIKATWQRGGCLTALAIVLALVGMMWR